MKEHPIIFNTENVKAILDGRKTQTRRVIKPQPYIVRFENSVPFKLTGKTIKRECETCHHPLKDGKECAMIKCPYGQVGDRLWVRETYYHSEKRGLIYKADYPKVQDTKWKPSIFMPRWASRITLEITEVRVERVQEIIHQDIIKEGVVAEEMYPSEYINIGNYAITRFAKLWDSLNAKRGYGWDTNCWVWVVSFKRIEE